MILRPVRPQSPSGPPTTKFPVGLTRKSDVLLWHPAFGQCRNDGFADQILDHARRIFFAVTGRGVVLRRNHDLGAADRLAVNIFYRDLAFGVRLQIEQRAGAAFIRQHFENLVGEINRRRHERALFVDLALGAGVAEHHALVAGALVLLAFLLFGVDAHGNVGRLAMQQHLDIGAVKGKAALVVADILDHAAGDLGDQLAIDNRDAADLAEQLAAAFAGDNNLVGGAKCFAAQPGVDQAVVGDAELDILLDECIENGIGNLVGDFVRVTLPIPIRS